MNTEQRLEAFEAMLAAVKKTAEDTASRMTQLKKDGREKTVTYRQLMTTKLQYQNFLSLYQLYGLLDEEENGGESHD